MGNLQSLYAVVDHLVRPPPPQFLAWFRRFDADDWNLQQLQDFGQGALNRFAEEALAHQAASLCRER
jgi:hypothetical protein